MDERVVAALADVPDAVEWPAPEELAERVAGVIEEAIRDLKVMANWPARLDDPMEWRGDTKPLNVAANALLGRLRAWCKATGEALPFGDITELNDDAEGAHERMPRLATVDVNEYLMDVRGAVHEALGQAAVGRYRLGEKRYGSVVSRLMLDEKLLDELIIKVADMQKELRKRSEEEAEWA